MNENLVAIIGWIVLLGPIIGSLLLRFEFVSKKIVTILFYVFSLSIFFCSLFAGLFLVPIAIEYLIFALVYSFSSDNFIKTNVNNSHILTYTLICLIIAFIIFFEIFSYQFTGKITLYPF